jgi:tripartite-type tricarboxylate transporter receptor subunit TctC
MKLPRRNFLHLAAGAAALSALPRVAGAEAYPARTVTIIVPVAAGGTTDRHCSHHRPVHVSAVRAAIRH